MRFVRRLLLTIGFCSFTNLPITSRADFKESLKYAQDKWKATRKFVSEKWEPVRDFLNEKCMRSLQKDAAMLTKAEEILKNPAFWNLKLEKLVPYIDPTVLDLEESPEDLHKAFNINDFNELQETIEALAFYFMQDDQVQDALIPSLPKASRDARGYNTLVDTDLFPPPNPKTGEIGPTQLRILKKFMLYKVLRLGPPRKASNEILFDLGRPSRRERGLVGEDVSNERRLLPSLLSTWTSLRVQGSHMKMFWETWGAKGALPAILRPLYEEIYINIIQYGHYLIPDNPRFSELPEKYASIALARMNATPGLLSRLRPEIVAKLPLKDKNPEQPKAEVSGDWTAAVVSSIEEFAWEHRAEYLGLSGDDLNRPLTNDEYERLMEESLSARDFFAYRRGMEKAVQASVNELTVQKRKLVTTALVEANVLYNKLLVSKQESTESQERISAAVAKYNKLDPEERLKILESTQAEFEAYWGEAFGPDLYNFGVALLREYAVCSLFDMGADPRHLVYFQNNPKVQLALERAIVRAQKDDKPPKRQKDEESFQKLLLPSVYGSLYPHLLPSADPLAARIVISYDAESYKEATVKTFNYLKTLVIAAASIGAVWGIVKPIEQKLLQPPAINTSTTWHVTHDIPINLSKGALLDPDFEAAVKNMQDLFLVNGLSKADERFLVTVARNIKPDRIPDHPAELKATFLAMLKDKDFDWFHDWGPAFNNKNARAIPEALWNKRSLWLLNTIELLRQIRWDKAYQDEQRRQKMEDERRAAEEQKKGKTTSPEPSAAKTGTTNAEVPASAPRTNAATSPK